MTLRKSLSFRLLTLLLAALFLLPALTFAGCKNNEPTPVAPDADIRAEALLRGLLQRGIGSFGSPCCYEDAGYAERFTFSYHTDMSKITDGAMVYADGVCADEITILRPATQADATELTEALRAHVKEQITAFEGYSPEDVAKLQDARLYRDGGFVILLVSDRADALRAAVSELLADPSLLPEVEPLEEPSDVSEVSDSSETSSEKVSEIPSEPDEPSEKEEPSEPDEPSEKEEPSEPEEPSEKEEPSEPEEPSDKLIWNYPTAVKAGAEVDESYFDDAVFIGDSRLDDLVRYVGAKPQADYTYTSLTASAVFTKNLVDGDTIASALRSGGKFGKCYLTFGFNELGWHTPEPFIADYEKVVALVREVSPDADIFILNLYPVSGSHSEKSLAHPDGLKENNPRVALYNERIADMASRLGLKLVNTCEPIADEKGLLSEQETSDGCHADPVACRRLWAYLKTHTGN